MLLKCKSHVAWKPPTHFLGRSGDGVKMRHLRVWFAPEEQSFAARSLAGRHKAENMPSGKTWENNSCLNLGAELAAEGNRAGLGQSKRNGRVYFLLLLFGGNEKSPTVLFWVNPNRILNVVFCFEVTYPSCFSHFLLFQSLLSGKCHFKIANQGVVFKRHHNKMLWHLQKKPFLSRNVDMSVLSPYILGPVENACHFSFILEASKQHVLGVTWAMGGLRLLGALATPGCVQGTGRGSQQRLGQSPSYG